MRWVVSARPTQNEGSPNCRRIVTHCPYYHHWLATLERLLTAKRRSDEVALLTSKEAWDQQQRFFCATLTEL